MKVKQVISISPNGRKMEVICDDGKTRHIHKVKNNKWTYRDDRKGDKLIEIEVKETS